MPGLDFRPVGLDLSHRRYSPPIAVYYDRIYRTFLFTPFSGAQPALSGTIAGAAAGQQVDAVASGVTYTGFTNAAGAFRIYGVPAGVPMEIHAGSRQVLLSRPATTATPGQD